MIRRTRAPDPDDVLSQEAVQGDSSKVGFQCVVCFSCTTCTLFPCSNEQMSLKEDYACLLLTSGGEIEYARHPIFRCQRTCCIKKPGRAYDSMYYKETSVESKLWCEN